MPTAVIVDIVRTASGKGKPGGAVSDMHPVDLLAGVLSALVARSDLDPALIDTSSSDVSPKAPIRRAISRATPLSRRVSPSRCQVRLWTVSAARHSRRCTSPPRA
jgi:acetyl-CoA acetyltransferase